MGQPRVIASGRLIATTDSLALVAEHVLLVDAPEPFDLSLINQEVTIAGHMGVPPASTFEKLIADKIVAHSQISLRAYDLHQENPDTSAVDDWLRAERELTTASSTTSEDS